MLTWIGKQTQNSWNFFFLLVSVWQNIGCLVYYTTISCNAIENGNTRSLRCSKESQTGDPVFHKCQNTDNPWVRTDKKKLTVSVTLLTFIIICFSLCWQTWINPKLCQLLRKGDRGDVSSLCSSPNSEVALWTLDPEGDTGKNFSSDWPSWAQLHCKAPGKGRPMLIGSRGGGSWALRDPVWVTCLWHAPGWAIKQSYCKDYSSLIHSGTFRLAVKTKTQMLIFRRKIKPYQSTETERKDVRYI